MSTIIDAEERRTRLRSLDGIRGLGAVLVLFTHAITVYPMMEEVMVGIKPVQDTGSFLWWFTHTPLHLPWLGVEFVYAFFVMSGIVLVLPVLRTGSRFDWKRYYPRRLARLYLPVWGAILFTIVLTLVIGIVNPGNDTVIRQTALLTGANIVREFALVLGSTGIDGPLWSLQWEIIFSLLLPVFVVFAVKWRNLWVLKLSLIFASIVLGAGFLLPQRLVGDAFFYLPMFALGAMIAVEFDRIEAVAQRLNAGTAAKTRWIVLCTLTGVALCTYWYVQAFSPPASLLLASRSVSFLASVSFIFIVLFYGPVKRLFQSRVVQWFGRISFSMYLIHVPILWAINSFLPDELRFLTIVIGIPVSVAAGEVFRRIIEVPSHRFSKHLFSAKKVPVTETELSR